jgi:energy-coupling factor transporter ATP-binding protein EcfA2
MNSSDMYNKIDPRIITSEQALMLNDKQKLLYFYKVRIKHPNVKRIISDMMTISSPGSGTSLALLIGPTGVGKTTLAKALLERLVIEYKSEMAEDSSMIPAVLVNMPSAGANSFSWRLFYTLLGRTLMEPLLHKKQEDKVQDGCVSLRHISSGSTLSGLRLSIEDALQFRSTVLVIIDEAVHIMRNAKDEEELTCRVETLKSLTTIEEYNLTIAMVGSYDLYEIMDLNDQLTRRSAIVHFGRYRSDKDDDKKVFTDSLENIMRYFPLVGVPDLTCYSDELMRSCLGCVGILKETLQRALSFALRDNGKWTDACLKKALLTEKQIITILEKTLEGEKAIEKAVYGSGSFRLNV